MKAGYVYEGIFFPTETGTPQGGVISPLLSNIGLHGLEELIKINNKRMGIIRYADDFVVTAKSKKEIEEITPKIKQWVIQTRIRTQSRKNYLSSYR